VLTPIELLLSVSVSNTPVERLCVYNGEHIILCSDKHIELVQCAWMLNFLWKQITE